MKQPTRWTSRKFIITAAVVVVMFAVAYHTAGDDWISAMKQMGALLGALLAGAKYVGDEAKVDAARKRDESEGRS